MAPKRAKSGAGQLSAKQAALAKKLQTMAGRATANQGFGAGARLLGIHGSGRFFEGVDEVEPSLVLRVSPSPNIHKQRKQFLQWVWIAVHENQKRFNVIETEAFNKWEAKVANHPTVVASKKWEEAWAAFRAGSGPDPGRRPETDDENLGLFHHVCDDDYKAAVDVEPLGSVADGCMWAVRQLASGTPCHDDKGTALRGEKRASWAEVLEAWKPLDAAGIEAVAGEWGARLSWKQARKAGGEDDFPHGVYLTFWFLTRGLGRFKDLTVSAASSEPQGRVLWTDGQVDVAATMAELFGGGSASGGGGGASSSSASGGGTLSEAQRQELGLTLWQLAHLQAWQAILEVAVRQLLTPQHQVHSQMAAGEGGTQLFKCEAFTTAAEHAGLAAVAHFGSTATSLIRLHKDDGSGYSSRLLGVLIEHAGLGGHKRAAGMLELKMWGRAGVERMFPAPAPESLAQMEAERPRWSRDVALKKLRTEVRSAQLLVDGLAALVGHAEDMHATDLNRHGRGDFAREQWLKAQGLTKYGRDEEDVYGDRFKWLRWPICGALHSGRFGMGRLHIALPGKHRDAGEMQHLLSAGRLSVLGKPDGAGGVTGGGDQPVSEQLDDGRLTLPSAGQLVVNECVLALLALRATPSKVGPASAVHRALVQLTLPRTAVEVFGRLDDPAGAGLRAHLWQHRRPFFLVRSRTPESVLGRLPLDLFEHLLKEFIGTGYAAAAYV